MLNAAEKKASQKCCWGWVVFRSLLGFGLFSCFFSRRISVQVPAMRTAFIVCVCAILGAILLHHFVILVPPPLPTTLQIGAVPRRMTMCSHTHTRSQAARRSNWAARPQESRRFGFSCAAEMIRGVLQVWSEDIHGFVRGMGFVHAYDRLSQVTVHGACAETLQHPNSAP